MSFPSQNLISVLDVTLAGGAEIAIPHNLRSNDRPIAPYVVTCDRASPIGVLSANDLVVVFRNLSDGPATATFRVVREHSISTDPKTLVAWQGWDGTANPAGPAGGDLDGSYPNPTVVGLEGYPIENPPPSNGDALLFDGALNKWVHAPITFGGGPPVGPAGGDLSGVYPNPTVDGLQGTPVAPTIPNDGELLRFTAGAWRPATITSIGDAYVGTYGVFCDTTDQPIPTLPSSVAVKYNCTELSNGVTLTNNGLGQPTRLTVSKDGIYAFDISPQLLHTGGTGTVIHFWAKVDGLDVPRSASSLEMGNNNNRTLPFLQLELAMNAGQYLEWYFAQSGVNTNLEHFPAAGPVPEIPSIIVSVKRFSALP